MAAGWKERETRQLSSADGLRGLIEKTPGDQAASTRFDAPSPAFASHCHVSWPLRPSAALTAGVEEAR